MQPEPFPDSVAELEVAAAALRSVQRKCDEKIRPYGEDLEIVCDQSFVAVHARRWACPLREMVLPNWKFSANLFSCSGSHQRVGLSAVTDKRSTLRSLPRPMPGIRSA